MRKMCIAACAALIAASPASARVLEFVYQGTLFGDSTLNPTADPAASAVASGTAFTFKAKIDTTSPSQQPPFLPPFIKQGWTALTPVSASIAIGGKRFGFDATSALVVALFDPSNNLGENHGAYGAGWYLSPGFADGAGSVGHFNSASPDFGVTDIKPATFGGYEGAGFSSGIGCPTACPATRMPIPLVAANGTAYTLTFAGGVQAVALGAPVATAALLPEPGALGVLGLGMGGLALRRRRG